MTFDQYQIDTRQTAVYPEVGGHSYIYPALGLSGEVGEVMEHVKKAIRDDGGTITAERLDKLGKEIGDVLWYLARLSDELGLSLNDVATGNIKKLLLRKEQGTIHGSGSAR